MDSTGRDHARFAERFPAGKKNVGLRPTTRWGRKAPDPISFGTARSTRHDLGSYFYDTFLVDNTLPARMLGAVGV